VQSFIGAPPDHEYTEVESGKKSDRQELLKALDLAELTGATLIVAKLDRLSRDAEFLSKLQKAPVKIIFADMPFADSFMIGIMAQVAQWEREQISKRTKAALKVAKERGRQIGGDRGHLASFSEAGAKASAEARAAVAQARASKVLPHVRQARAEGFRSFKAIAAYLNRRGIRTSRGNEWGGSAVRRLECAS
jgi:DNA invertase Pin-like site-specific DNA recombinase